MWSAQVRRHLSTIFYGLYFSHHIKSCVMLAEDGQNESHRWDTIKKDSIQSFICPFIFKIKEKISSNTRRLI